MTIVRAQVAWGADLPEVRHRLCITPHFKTTGAWPGDDPGWQPLCDDLATAMAGYANGTREVQVKLYNAEEPQPNYPKATKTLNTGTFPASALPRELALCLSYRAGDGPRKRGRLYVPAAIMSSTSAALRPTALQITKAGELAPLLRALGGVNVDWGVWSRVNNAFYTAETAYVDNEWDIIRSRGLQPTTRTAAGTGG